MRQRASIPPKPGTRARILDAAAQVLSADPSAGLDAVAAAAGVGRATLHRHFTSRADLVRETGRTGLQQLSAALADAALDRRGPRDALRVLCEILVPFGDRLHFLLASPEVASDRVFADAERAVDARILPVLERCVATKVLDRRIPQAWLFRAFEALLYAAWTAVATGDLARNEAPSLLLDACLHGFAAPAPVKPRRSTRP